MNYEPTLRDASARIRQATADRDAAIVGAVRSGMSKTAIAHAAGLSRMQIHRIAENSDLLTEERTPRTTGYTVAVEAAEAYTLERAQDAANALRNFIPVPISNVSETLTLILKIIASSLPAAAAIALRAVEDDAGLQARALEFVEGSNTLVRARP
ncbi:MAG: hypothetical protein ACTHZX_11795 [Microbacterium sp.]